VRRARRYEQDAADPEAAAYRMRATTTYAQDGSLVLTIRMSAADAPFVQAALEQVRAELDRDRRAPSNDPAEPVAETESESAIGVSAETCATDAASAVPSPGSGRLDEAARATLGEAFLAMAKQTLDRVTAEHPDIARRYRSPLALYIDPLSGWGRTADGEFLPPSVLTRAGAPMAERQGGGNSWSLRALTDTDFSRHDVGRRQRLPSLVLRELLGTVDGERCRFPGCSRIRKLHAHHVIHWSKGGGTDLGNLALLCSRHHMLVHGRGFRLELGPGRRLSVKSADGVPVLHHPGLPRRPAEELDPVGLIDALTLPPDGVDRCQDLGYAVMVLMQQAA